MSWLGQAAGLYFGAWWGASPSSQAVGGFGSARRKRYFIEQAGRLLVFASAAAAQAALAAAVVEPSKAKARDLEPINTAEQQIDLAALQAQAELAGQLAAYQAAYQSRHFAALLALFEQLQDDEDDVELLLLSL